MKTELFSILFASDPSLAKLLKGKYHHKKDVKEIHSEYILENLFQFDISNANDYEYFKAMSSKFWSCLERAITPPPTLIIATLHEDQLQNIHKFFKMFCSKLFKQSLQVKQIFSENYTIASSMTLQEYNLYLYEFPKYTTLLQQHRFRKAHELQNILAYNFASRPNFSKELYKIHQIGKNFKGNTFKNGHYFVRDIQSTKETHHAYVLSQCPSNIDQLGNMLNIAFQDDTNLFVSTLQSFEGCKKSINTTNTYNRCKCSKPNCRKNIISNKKNGTFCNNWWTNDVLKEVPLRYGWTIKNESDPIQIHKSTISSSVENDVSIYKSNLIAMNYVTGEVRKLVHLHYNGWSDGKMIPDEDLFQKLLQEIDAEAKGPILIHCYQGRNRSAVTLLSHYLLQEIRNQLDSVPLENVKINVIDIIYKCKQVRPEFLTRAGQLTNVYSIVGKWYIHLKNISDLLSTWSLGYENVNTIILSY